MIIDGGAEHLAKQAFYKVGKSAVALRLAYTLNTAAPEAGRIFFSRELPKTIEVFDNAAGRYIKCNPATGESLVGRIEGVEGKTITFEKLETNPALVGQSDEAIAKELQVTAESFVKGAGKALATSGDELISLCKNVSKGSDEMVLAAKTKIADYIIAMKGQKKLGGNLGYVEGEINGIKLEDELVSSTAVKVDAPEIFEAKYVNSQNQI